MGLILHIESASKSCSVALSLNGKLINCVEEHGDQYIHGEKLALFIKDILENSSVSMNDLEAVSISSGPGSYTGLRIGTSIAKGICYALSIPLIAVDTLQTYEKCARKIYTENVICVMLDARRLEVYSTIFNEQGEIIKPLSADVLNENSYSDFEPFVCIGDGGNKMRELWANRSIQIHSEIQLSATGQIELAFHKFQTKDFVDVAYFEPNYLKEFYTGN